MDDLFQQYGDIMTKPNYIEDFWQGHTYQRWSGFSDAPIDNLLQINVHILVAVGTADQSVPVESAYLIPVEFRRYGKTNLTLRPTQG
ncbi:MAG: hypothetical protein ACI84C_002086 [Flavobacteriales bacterium]|jgi:hypothetical protein